MRFRQWGGEVKKYLVINGSPRGESSKTLQVAKEFAFNLDCSEVEIINVSEKTINPCKGCHKCLYEKKEYCHQWDSTTDDDMKVLRRKYFESDTVIFSTPVYFFSIPGILKNFIDRLFSCSEPFMIKCKQRESVSSHPLRKSNLKNIFLIASCGFPEYEHFKPLIETFKWYAMVSNVNFLGYIACPASHLLSMDIFKDEKKNFLSLVRSMGKKIVETKAITENDNERLKLLYFAKRIGKFRRLANEYSLKKLNERDLGTNINIKSKLK